MKTKQVYGVNYYTSAIKFYPYGTLVWIKKEDGSITQAKVVFCQVVDNNLKFTYLLPNGNKVLGSLYMSEIGSIWETLEMAKKAKWDYNPRPVLHLTENMGVNYLVKKKYDCGLDVVKISGIHSDTLSINGYKLDYDGSVKIEHKLDFDIQFNENEELEIYIPAFDNEDCYPNPEGALAQYHPHVETFFDSGLEATKENKLHTITIIVDDETLETIKGIGVDIL